MKEITVKGKSHSLVALRILEWDATGRPSKCTIGYDDTTFRLDNGEPNEFFTAFVPTQMIEKKGRH